MLTLLIPRPSDSDRACWPRRLSPRRGGFSITELLVVVGIIVLLVALLLVALGGVRRKALATQTLSTMRGFSQAADSFQLEHGYYPGVVREEILGQDQLKISGMENALLHLMGGAIVEEDPSYNSLTDPPWGEIDFQGQSVNVSIKVSLTAIGEGPVIDGVSYAPYFTPADRDRELGFVAGQAGEADDERLPDLLDAWGQPIVYLRQMRSVGPLVGPPPPYGANRPPQFLRYVMQPYTDSNGLGVLGADQAESLFNTFTDEQANALLAQIIRHPAFGAEDDPLNGTARGAYVLIAPGPDGVFFSEKQVPNPDDLEEILRDPKKVKDFDDIILFGGG